MGRQGAHGQLGPLRSLIEFASPYPAADLELQPARFNQGSFLLVGCFHHPLRVNSSGPRFRELASTPRMHDHPRGFRVHDVGFGL